MGCDDLEPRGVSSVFPCSNSDIVWSIWFQNAMNPFGVRLPDLSNKLL